MKCFVRNILIFLILTGILYAQQKEFSIKYISASHVYLQGGRSDGLEIGDTLKVFRRGGQLGIIKIDYVSNHSSSCTILEKRTEIKTGDVARLLKKTDSGKPEAVVKKSNEQAESLTNVGKRRPHSAKRLMRINGYFSLQLYYFKDLGTQDFNFIQPTARFRLRIARLWQSHFNFEIKFRTRFNQRSRRFTKRIPKSEWQNRLYSFTIDYNNPQALFNFKAGRIISNVVSGVGYIDGGLIQLRLSPSWQFGVFGGTQPDWESANFQTEIQKYGSFIRYQKGDYQSDRLEFVFAGTGEYHGATVSREFIYAQVLYTHGRKWSIYQNLELDVNRSWRKRLAGESLSLSGLYLYANYHFTRGIGASLSYDNRKNYYTYELRSLADSLFDDAFRQGVRANVYLNILKDYRFSLNFGLREKETDARFSYSYGFRMTRRNFFDRSNKLYFRFSGFDNVFATGYNPNLGLSHYFSHGHYLSLTYGNYFYMIKNQNSNRMNHWLRLNGQMELPARLYFNTTYEYDWGSDVKGHRLLMEFGYRF